MLDLPPDYLREVYETLYPGLSMKKPAHQNRLQHVAG